VGASTEVAASSSMRAFCPTGPDRPNPAQRDAFHPWPDFHRCNY
jgi:hypothetical protein